jgi:hypothetical protein
MGYGASFPGSPATNDLFFRTDRGFVYRYDGSGWVAVDPSRHVAFRAYRNSAQSMTNGIYNRVKFDTEMFDYSGSYQHTTGANQGIFTVPEAGLYMFAASVILLVLADQKQVVVVLRQNGNDRAQHSAYASSQGNPGGNVADVLDCAAGDTIEVYVYNGDTIARNCGTGTASHFSGARIG